MATPQHGGQRCVLERCISILPYHWATGMGSTGVRGSIKVSVPVTSEPATRVAQGRLWCQTEMWRDSAEGGDWSWKKKVLTVCVFFVCRLVGFVCLFVFSAASGKSELSSFKLAPHVQNCPSSPGTESLLANTTGGWMRGGLQGCSNLSWVHRHVNQTLFPCSKGCEA